MLIDGILSMLPKKRQTKACSMDMNPYHLRKSSESPRGPSQDVHFRKSSESPRHPSQDVDSAEAEARRKTAAWQWYQRGKGALHTKRKTVERGEAAAHRDCIVDRPMSRFKAEAKKESSSDDSSSKSTGDRETSVFDASELARIAGRVLLLIQNLKTEGASESPALNPVQSDDKADVGLNEPAVDVSSTVARSQPRIPRSPQRPMGKENTTDLRSPSHPPSSRQLHQQKSGGIAIQSGAVQSKKIAEKQRFFANADFIKQRKSSSFHIPFSVARKLFQGISRWNGHLRPEVNTQEQIHHYYYHHHHIYYHHNSPEALPPPEINAKTPRPRRNSENFGVHTEEGSPEHGSQRNSRRSFDVGSTYRLDHSGNDAPDVWDSYYRPEGILQGRAQSPMQGGMQTVQVYGKPVGQQ